MIRAFIIFLALTFALAATPTHAQNKAVEMCKTKAIEAQTACENAQKSQNNVALVIAKLAVMVAALAGGTQGGMCQMMASMSNANANQLQASVQPCLTAAAACKASCATADADSGTKSEADKTNLSAAQNNCVVAEKQGQSANNDVMKLLDFAATAAVCLKELGMKDDTTTTTTTTTTPTLNCTDPANNANPVCLCQANPMGAGCGNQMGEVKPMEGREPGGPSGTDSNPTTLSNTRNDGLAQNQRSPTGRGDLPKARGANAPAGADGAAAPAGTANPGAAKAAASADVLGGQLGGGAGGRGGGGGGYPEFVSTSSGLRPVARGPSSAKLAFMPGGLLGKHRDLFKTVHKRYKSVFGGEKTEGE